MALSYDDWKNQWEGMTDVQRARVSQSMKDNATFQDYGKRYVQEQKGMNINPTGYQNNTQNAGSTVSDNSNGGINNTEGTNNTPTVETSQNGGTNTEPTEGTQGDGKIYGKTEFDPEETLQEDKFGQDPGKITIYEGTGKDTGRPDYEIETEARLKEMTDNLDHYYATQPKLFSDRNTFNEFFQYNDRPSDQQRALLDSYWQKKQDENKAKSYTSGDALAADLNSGNMTQDVWNQVMEGNQKAYIEWQERMKNELELAIANFAAPFNPDTLADTLQSLVNKLGIQAGDPYDIIGGWENKMQELGAYQSLHELDSTVNQLKSVASQRQNIINRYASSAGGTQSDALVAARLNKALAPYDQQFSDLYTLYQTQHTTYQTKLGTANQYAQVMQMQAQEDQRIFNNKIESLGFAMKVYDYRTPEQKKQLELQYDMISNDMNLLNKAKENDLALYNKRQQNQLELQYMYDKAEMQNAIDLDMTDLTVENEGQLRANLNNVLSQYYAKFGDIIKRPQSGVVEDVLRYAKEHGVSVAEALQKEFIEKLMEKEEYQNYLKNNYSDPYMKYQNSWNVSMDKDGNVTWDYSGYGDLPTNITKGKLIGALSEGFEDMYGDGGSYINSLTALEGKQGLWCGEFVNAGLEGMGDKSIFGDSLVDKIKVCNRDVSEGPKYGAAVVLDTGAKVTDKKGNVINAGHVGFITGVTKDGVYITDSNWDGNKTVSTHFMTNEQLEKMAKGYYVSPAVQNADSSSAMTKIFQQAINNAGTGDERKALGSANFIYDKLSKLQQQRDSDGYSYLEHFIMSSDFEKLMNNMDSQVFAAGDEGAGILDFLGQWTKDANLDNINRYVMNQFETMIEEKLRNESGAAISSSEWRSNFKMMIPQPGLNDEFNYKILQNWDDKIRKYLYTSKIDTNQYVPIFSDSYIQNMVEGGIPSKGGSSYASYNNTPAQTNNDSKGFIGTVWGSIWNGLNNAF